MSNKDEADLPNDARALTERQRAVIERIDRRVPIKVIAQELGVSETRINQHIRALKNVYQVESLNELVETYRAEREDEYDLPTGEMGGLSESAYNKNQVPIPDLAVDPVHRVDPGEIVINDVLALTGQASWEIDAEPKVVPGMLDGDHAVMLRLAVIVGIAFGILAAVVLMVTAAMTLSEALDGKAYVPEEAYKPAD